MKTSAHNKLISKITFFFNGLCQAKMMGGKQLKKDRHDKVDKLYDVHEKPHIIIHYGVRRIIIKSAKVVSSR